MRPKTKAKNQVCFWCGRPAQYWETSKDRYCCSDTHQQCPTFKMMLKHRETCPLPPSYHILHPVSKIKCYKLLYEMYESRVEGDTRRRMRSSQLLQLSDLQMGTAKCKYCGEKANHFLATFNCCSESARDCPSYHDFISQVMFDKYKNDPGLVDRMSKSSKIAQNKSKVKAAKRKAMKRLHRGNCDECVTFQTNYHNSPVGKPKEKTDD